MTARGIGGGEYLLRESVISRSSSIDFLNAPGDMASLIRSFYWSSTTLGLIEDWPQSLKTMTSFLVRSPIPIVLLWGLDGIMIYNDAYSVFAGGRHRDCLAARCEKAGRKSPISMTM